MTERCPRCGESITSESIRPSQTVGRSPFCRLTRREREVLALLVDGRSNKQIGEQLYMAESTAGVHVSNILAKLGVARRSEAMAMAHRLGLPGLS